jgi:hypothetical protein
LTGIENVRVAAMVAPNGRRMKDTRFFDTEGMARIGNRLFVSVERAHQIIRFEIGAGGPAGRGVLVSSPEGLRGLNSNQGIEALGVLPAGSPAAGSLIGIAERGKAPDDIPGWIFSGPGAGAFQVVRTRDFDVTDLGFLPSGDMILLERRFSPFWGIAFRLRRFKLAQVEAGARLDGETIFEANMAYQIDNMEALTIHRAGDGRTIFTLFSDNNFSVLQRNLILRFAYSG